MLTSGLRKRAARFAALGAAAALVATAAPASAATVGTIDPTDLGIHADSLLAEAAMGTTGLAKPGVAAGTLRIPCLNGGMWRDVQPTKGTFNWTKTDKIISTAKSWGYSDILYAVCGTPEWAAAGPVKLPDKEILGPGSTAAPANMKYWATFVKAFAKRYKGKVSHLQVWNEFTSPQFYQGTPKQMVTMTTTAAKAVKGTGMKLVAASVQTHVPLWYDTVAKPYFKGLKKAKWPVVAMAGHFYTTNAEKAGPDLRMKRIAMMTKDLRKLGYPSSKEIWDTESNFRTDGPGSPGDPNGRVTGDMAATWTARAFLDSWRSGLTRTYWYTWALSYQYFPGIQTRAGDPATTAYNTLRSWVSGAKFLSCSKGKPVVCQFKKGKKFAIAFTIKGTSTYRFSGKKSVCPVNGAACTTAKKSVTVRQLPVKIG